MGIYPWRRGVIQKTHWERRSQLSPVLHSLCPSHGVEAAISLVHTKEGCLGDKAAPYFSTFPPALRSVW